MNDRVVAHGRSAHATLAWMSGRRVRQVSMLSPPTHFGMPDPKTPEHVEAACRLLLSVPLGEQLAEGGTPDQYITADRSEVGRARDLVTRLGSGDPVDHLERIYDDLGATLASPRIWHCVARLAETLRKDRLILSDRCASVLRSAMADHRAVASPPMPPRKVYVSDEQRR